MLASNWKSLDPNDRKVIAIMAALVFVIYACIIAFSATRMAENRAMSVAKHSARMNPAASEPGRTAPDPYPQGTEFVTVKVGTYIDDIENVSIKDSAWQANFYVWFTWQGDPKLDPGSKLIVVDGGMAKKDLLEAYYGTDGTNYQRYKVSARMIKFFDTARVPIEDHMLNIYLEDGSRDATRLRFVPDASSNMSSRVAIPGFQVTRFAQTVKPHTYKSAYGDPRVAPDAKKVFSQYIAAVEIRRIDFGVYLKIFLSLFAALLLTLSSFFIKASDIGPRFSLPTAAYFGAVANSYVANSILPPSGSFGLVDHISFIGIFTIFATIALGLVSNYFSRKERKELSFALDRTMVIVVGSMCLLANLAVPYFARG